MNRVEKMRGFIIRFCSLAIWVAIIYCGLKYALPLFMPFVIAFGIAFLLKPLINFITAKTPLGRKAVAIILLILVYLLIAGALIWMGGKLFVFLGGWFSRLPEFYRSTLEPALASLSSSFDAFIGRLDPGLSGFIDTANQSISQAVSNIVSSISSGAVGFFTGVAGSIPWIIVAFVLSIIASFFFVVDYYTITSFITRQLPEKGREMLFTIKDFVVNVLFKFGRAYLILLSITFVEVFLGLTILQVPHALPIAIITAIVDILPVFGTGTIMLPWAVYLLITANWFQGIGMLVLYALITIIRQIIEPRIVGRQIGLYPLLTLICMFVGARLFGFWGMFGFPITLVVLIHLNRLGMIRIFKE